MMNMTRDLGTGNYLLNINCSHITQSRVEQVKQTTIDDFVRRNGIDRIDFIKCDVEGAEKLVIDGARRSLEQFQPILLLEILETWTERYHYRPEDLFVLLTALGYRYLRCTPKGVARPKSTIRESLLDCHNFLFYHDKHCPLLCSYL